MTKRERLEQELAETRTALTKQRTETRAAVDDENSEVADVKAGMEKITKLEEAVAKLESDVATLKDAEELPEDDTVATSTTTEGEASESRDDQDELEEERVAKEKIIPEDKDKEEEKKNMKVNALGANEKRDATPLAEERAAINAYLHSKGENRDGVKSTDVGVLIPEEIIYNPQDEINTVTDLSAFVEKTAVTTASGKYPILKRASTTLPSVAELEKNPDLAKPQFEQVEWNVQTYRGALPLSQESIADSQIDLTSLVARHISNIKVNTTNAAIASVLAGFTKEKVVEATVVDDLKTLINTEFDVAYNLSIVVTKSFFDVLDHAKDGDGRYLLQDQIGTQTGKTLFGLNVVVVEDTAFGGKAGAKQAFVGDLKRAVLFADRLAADVNWVDNDIYGKLLQAVIRFDVKPADKDAGRFIELSAAAK
ncbi:phage major capsid protein [Weissella viridescens]|uniref:phage major capsid protein n=1 Tax=Weissella viridescens TaxID=1629 RepID=UPI003AF2CD90